MRPVLKGKFFSQAVPEVLAALREIAEIQGRQFQAMLEEAPRDCIDRQQTERPRRHLMMSFATRLDEFDCLYRELAKYHVARDDLTVADVTGMHAELMKRYGATAGVRDPGAQESAFFRPQAGYCEDVIADAAALFGSLAINHPAVDGNRHVAARQLTSSSASTGGARAAI